MAAEIFLVPAPCTHLSELNRLIIRHHGSINGHGTVPDEFPIYIYGCIYIICIYVFILYYIWAFKMKFKDLTLFTVTTSEIYSRCLIARLGTFLDKYNHQEW